MCRRWGLGDKRGLRVTPKAFGTRWKGLGEGEVGVLFGELPGISMTCAAFSRVMGLEFRDAGSAGEISWELTVP